MRAAARAIAPAGIGAVAIVLLHSYANPAHERRAAAILAAEHPEALVSLSSEVLPVFREYERSMTTLLNAYVMPVVATYVERLEQRARRARHRRAAAADEVERRRHRARAMRGASPSRRRSPARRPARSARASSARAPGFATSSAIDIGGTSADIALIHDGAAAADDAAARSPAGRSALPMVDIMTIGAGGGSIARVSTAGALTVGPESAGADPGPACYGRGGDEPTVTDAHLVLGHLPPFLLGGSFALDAEAAQRAVRAARRRAARHERRCRRARHPFDRRQPHGRRDPARLGRTRPSIRASSRSCRSAAQARCTVVAGAPYRHADLLVPPNPGVLSALGLLVSNLRAEFARTACSGPAPSTWRSSARVFAELEAEAMAWFEAERVPEPARRIRRQASLRYQHQGFELFVPWDAGEVTQAAMAETVRSFHRMHERLYTFAQEDTPVEMVTLSIAAEGVFPRPKLEELASGGALADAITAHQTDAPRRRSGPMPGLRALASGGRRRDPRSGNRHAAQFDDAAHARTRRNGRSFRQPCRNRARLTGAGGAATAPR